MMIESLHNHTTTSDGKLTHVQFLEEANKRGYKVVAFTDHDSLPSPSILAELSKPQWKTTFPTKYIWGIELTVSPPPELHVPLSTFHVVGLFVDPTNEVLRRQCQSAQEKREKRMKHIVTGLQKLGFTITAEMCLQQSDGETIGRPHIVRALQSVPQNEAVLQDLCLQFTTAREKDPSLAQAYPTFDTVPLWDKIYLLLLSNDCYIKGVYVDVDAPPLPDAAALIRQAGGIVILAHYFTIAKYISIETVGEWMDSGYLDGCETLYNLGKGGAQKEIKADATDVDPVLLKRNSDRLALREVCKQKNKVWFVGGGDIHTLEALDEYAASSNAAESHGMAEQLCKQFSDRISLTKTSSIIL